MSAAGHGWSGREPRTRPAATRIAKVPGGSGAITPRAQPVPAPWEMSKLNCDCEIDRSGVSGAPISAEPWLADAWGTPRPGDPIPPSSERGTRADQLEWQTPQAGTVDLA